MMLYWKNTNTLDDYYPAALVTVAPEQAEIAIIGSKSLDLEQFPGLKGLFKCGVGLDNVPFAECQARHIAVGLPGAETSNIIFEETANFTVYTILNQLYADSGDITSWKKNQRVSLNRKAVLVIGQGNIGSRVSNKLEQLVNVLRFDIQHQQKKDLYALLAAADLVSLHIPLTDATNGWFDADKLSVMKDGAILVNTARGQIVDESDLLKEIVNGRLRAAFDVFWKEPYTGPLKQFHPHRFFMTPHVASTCEQFLLGLATDLKKFVSELSGHGN